MTTLINGDIYIKIKPAIFNPTVGEQEEIEDKIYDIEFKEAHSGATSGTQDIKRILNFMEDIFKEKGKLDYSYIDDFHVLETDGEKVTMKIFERTLKKEITKTFSIENKQMSEYMRLIDFLNDAEFVGKKIKLYGNDPILTNPTVLYKTDYAMLIQEQAFGDKYIRMLDIRSLDKPLGEIDSTVEQYKDKKMLYKAIVKQLDDLSKICEKTDEHRRQK